MSRKQSFAHYLYRALENPRHRYFLTLNYSLGFVTVLSVGAIILETVPELTDWFIWLRLIEFITVGIFTAEYLVRLYYTKIDCGIFLAFTGSLIL